MAPPCRKWSTIQRLNRRTPEQRQRLDRARKEDEDTHLALVEDVSQVTKEIDSDYAMEHPHGAESWDTTTMKRMRGYYEGVCNRCQTGLYYKDRYQEGPVRKQTRVRTSSKIVAEALHLPCTCTQRHVQMDGKSQKLREMQNYEKGFTELAANAIHKCMEENWRKKEIAKIMVAEEVDKENKMKEVTKEDIKMSKLHPKTAVSIVAKLHRQLGHPGRDRLITALREAGMHDDLIEVAKSYKCDTCQNFVNKKPAKASALPQAQKFNEILEMDIFHIRWDDKKLRVLAIIDLFSRYEMNVEVIAETEKEELKILSDWINVFGCPQKIRTDASGAHMSEAFLNYMDDRNIKLDLIPKDAHHKMGTVERLHAVRRLQLLKMKQENPGLTLADAAPIACSLRNRLRSVHGSSPSQIVFGTNAGDLGLMDEPMTNSAEPTKQYQQLQQLRLQAAKAFYDANYNNTLRKALLSKSRSEPMQFFVGDWVYYWREGDSKLEINRWRGPALICSMQPRGITETDAGPRPDIYWLAHGSALVRVSHTSLRPETPPERQARLLHLLATARSQDVQTTVRGALHPVRGPVRFLDLLGDPPFADATGDDEPPNEPETTEQEKKDEVEEAIEGSGTAEADTEQPQPEQQQLTEPQQPHADMPHAAAEAQTNTAAAEATAQTQPDPEDEKMAEVKKRSHGPSDDADERPAHIAKSSSSADPREDNEKEATRSRSPLPRDERTLAFRSYNLSRQLDGLPPVQENDPAFQRFMDVTEPMTEDEALMAESFNEKKLNAEERKAFDAAKDAALMVWIENQAWKAVPESEAQEGEVVPARFLQRWKPTADGHVANARVILQGFRHIDVLSENLVRESPTLSRLGRMMVMVWATHRSWKLWCADIKSAFMQADSIDDSTRIYVRPPAEMRRRLERLMGLRSHEILKATKPAFGDVRAPRQWFDTADKYLTSELQLMSHPLDRCLYLSLRKAHRDDEEFLTFQLGEEWYIVDGVLGLHVDDFIGAGEQVSALQDVKHDPAGQCDCFQHRMFHLSSRFRFGSWDFGEKMRFCGAEVKQSSDFEVITVSLQQYVNKIKPLSMEKTRKVMVDDFCTEREHRQLRALVGAMSWPVTQCLPQAAASISLLQANINKPMVKDMLEANKCLRFLKEVVKSYVFTLRRHCSMDQLRVSLYCDAAWSVRPDGSSQGGMMMFLSSQAELDSRDPFPLTIVDWSSKKLTRMCRSSLSAEAQSATIAVDELEWTKVFMAAMVDPNVPIQNDETMLKFGVSAVITDAKALFDSTTSVTSGLKLSERRTAIEICILRERLEASGSTVRWCNSLQQLADGLTKGSSKDTLAHVLSRGVHSLCFDPGFVAAKKVSKEDRLVEEKVLEKAAESLFDGQICFAEDPKEKEQKGLCRLPGCKKPKEAGSEKNAYCSRRHYYLHQFRKGNGGDEWQKAAVCALTILTAENIPGAEAADLDGSEDTRFYNTMLVVLFFAFLGAWNSFRMIFECLNKAAQKIRALLVSVYD